MKNILLILLIFAFACSSEIEQKEEKMVNNSQKIVVTDSDKNSSTKPVSVVPSNIGLNDIVLKENTTWKDLDIFYKDELPKHEGKEYYNNLKNMLFFHLVKQYDLLGKADKKSIEFYTNEQVNMDFINDYNIFRDCLVSLKGYWEIDKIRKTAVLVHDKNINYIKNNFSKPTEYLEKKAYDLKSLSYLSVLSE